MKKQRSGDTLDIFYTKLIDPPKTSLISFKKIAKKH